MKLNDYRDTFYEFSDTTSKVNRYFAILGFVVACAFYMFNGDESFNIVLCIQLFAVGFILDIVHYIWAATTWGIFHRIKENEMFTEEIDEDSELYHSFNMIVPIYIFFYLKVIATITAYTFFIMNI